MKRAFSICLLGLGFSLALLATAAAQTQTQPLGDYARAVKKTKGAPANSSGKVYDNDNLPNDTPVSVVGNASAPANDASKEEAKDNGRDQAKDAAGQTNDQEKPAEKKPEINPNQSAQDRQKAIQEWKQKFEAQKAKIDLASRELDVMQREYRVKVAEYYADTARRVQNPNWFSADDAKYKEQIAQRQKALDEARQTLTDMQDDARKAGVPSSAID